jgi:hypothetical protein
MRWEVDFAGVELAPLASAHDLVGVSDRGGPVEALAKRISHEGTWCRMVAAHARMDVAEELAPLGDGYAPLQDAGCGTLVQLVVDNGE